MNLFALIAVLTTLASSPFEDWMAWWDYLEEPTVARNKLLIIGDSTTSKNGANFVPYYERLLYNLSGGTAILGAGVSISTGNTTDVSLNGIGQSSRLTEWASQDPDDSYPKTLSFNPLGYRMGDGVVSNSGNGLTSFATLHATGIDDSTDISPGGTDWIAGGNIKMRLAVVAGRTANDWVDQLSYRRSTDFGGSTAVNSWSSTALGDIQIAASEDGFALVDVTHTAPTDHRVGIQVRGPGSGNSPTTEGDAVAVASCWVWDADEESNADAYAVDSVSIGGWAANDFADKHDSDDYAEYLSAMPYVPDTVVIWLGQNTKDGEWTGSAWTQEMTDNIENIIDDVRAGATTAGIATPDIVLVVPPIPSSGSASRMNLLGAVHTDIATRKGCAVLDLSTIGTLDEIDAGYVFDGIHPTQSGTDFVVPYFWVGIGSAEILSSSGNRLRDRSRER